MTTLYRLLSLYAEHGLQIRTGLNPYHFGGYRDAPFTAVYRDGKILSTGGGIALQEVYFFECLFANYHPPSILVIGNAFGWSTLLLSLLNPGSRVVALDAGIEGEDTDFGIELTNRIARAKGMGLEVVKGFSPRDVEPVVSGRLGGRVDFVFVDGLHTEPQQELDYRAAARHRSPDGVLVFHDVVNFGMLAGFHRLAGQSGLNARILYRTPSGMGILYPDSLKIRIQQCLDAFTEAPDTIAALRKQTGWRGSLRSRAGRLLRAIRGRT
jgi:predicted O-methyltransferase YrrM